MSESILRIKLETNSGIEMDFFQVFITGFAIVIVVLLMAFFVCQIFGTKATAWIRSNKEEKIGLSKNNMYNANGYLIQSESGFLLSSTGSFKRFDSVDRDCKQEGGGGQSSPSPLLWNIPITDIPPQPLRPAPSPSPTSPSPAKVGLIRQESSNLHPIKQQSFGGSGSGTTTIISTTTSAVPRPVARRQLSSPASTGQQQYSPIKVPGSMHKIVSGPKTCTNPFLIEEATMSSKLNPSSLPDLVSDSIVNGVKSVRFEKEGGGEKVFENQQRNPFKDNISGGVKRDKIRTNTMESSPVSVVKPFNAEGLIFNFENVTKKEDQDLIRLDDENTESASLSLLEAEGSIKKLESQSENKTDWDYEKLLERNQQNAKFHMNKFQDYPSSDASEELQVCLKRLRSHSETEVSIFDRNILISNANKNSSTNPFLNFEVPISHRSICKSYNMTFNSNSTSMLSKTLSETYLGQYALSRTSSILDNGPPSPIPTWTFGSKSLLRQNSANSLQKPQTNSQNSLENGPERAAEVTFKRTLSCESVSSESSVLISDLEQTTPPVTGYLCIGLQYDKNNATEEGAELVVTVLEAKELIRPVDATAAMDTFVRIYLVPDESSALQTKLFRNSSCPSYNETFSFWLDRKHVKHSLWFHLYHSGTVHTLIGEAEYQISDVKRPITTWLALSDSRHTSGNAASSWGELMFSLSYLPTAERLTVVVVKARNLKLTTSGDGSDVRCESEDVDRGAEEAVSVSRRASAESVELENVFVKVYLLKDGKKVTKKRTSLKRKEPSPIYNESMIFSVPPYMLSMIQIRLTVSSSRDSSLENLKPSLITPIGHVIVGNGTNGKGLRHWNQMMTSLRKPVAMWHPLLRRCLDRSQKPAKLQTDV